MTLDPEQDQDILDGFSVFGESAQLIDSVVKALAKFVTLAYAKGSDTLPSARWKLFTKQMAKGDRLPPTPDAFSAST